MDLVFEHVKADCGIILCQDERRDELIPKIVRIRDETSPSAKKHPQPAANATGTISIVPTNGNGEADGNGKPPPEKIHASRTIINYVIEDRKSTRLNSSHSQISYAVFCLK